MLQTIHDKSKGWLAYVIVGFISIPFMLWGINSYLGGGDKLLAAQVNGEDISLQSFQRSLQMQRDRLREMFGGNVPAEMLEGAAIKQSVVETMVRDELLRQFAEEQNFQISGDQVASEIRSLPVFHENGKFSTTKYTQLLESRRMDKLGFESDIRYGMRLQQFRDAVQSSEFLTSAEYEQFKALTEQKRTVAYSVIEVTALEDSVELSEQQIAEYYEANKGSYLSEEKVTLEYVELNPDSVVEDIKVSADEVRAFYEQESDRFKTPEARKVSHILVKRGEGVTDEQLQAKAEEISQKLSAGEAFEDVARALSEDTFTAEKGGDLGLIYPGDLDAALESAIFAADLGASSEAVKTGQGIQFVKVTDIQASVQKTFDEVKSEAELELKQRQADTELLKLSEQLLTLTYENPESLDIAADAIGAEVKTTEWTTRATGTGIAAESKVREAAFSDDVLKSNRNSDVLEFENGTQVVVRIKEHKAASTLPLDEVEGQVKAKLLAKETRAKSLELGDAMAASVRSGEALKTAAANVAGTRYVEQVAVSRQSEDQSAELVGHVFKMNHPTADTPAVSSFQMANGDYVVVELYSVETPAVEGSENPEITEILSATYAERAFDAIYRFMESKAEIKIFNENL